MGKPEIYRLPLGGCNCYLVRQEGLILIDTGTPNQRETFRRTLERISVSPRDISLIILTHAHNDHTGSGADIKEITGAPVAINRHEQESMDQVPMVLPPGIGPVGKVMTALLSRVMPLLGKLTGSATDSPACPIDLVLDEEEFTLMPFGVEGKILHTPGHTAGSMSVLLDTGEALVGDLAMSFLPSWLGSPMPLLGDDPETIKRSWRLLLDNGARWIYPAHGKAFSADVLRKAL